MCWFVLLSAKKKEKKDFFFMLAKNWQVNPIIQTQ